MDLPEDEEGEEFKRINELKEEKVKEKIGEGDFNFGGAKLFEVDFSKLEIESAVNFDKAVIIKKASFEGAKIGGRAWFGGAKIDNCAWFERAEIGAIVSFANAKIGGSVSFLNTKIDEDAWFVNTKIGGNALFDGAKIGGRVFFDLTEIKEVCSFKKAKFEYPKAQEVACRTARKTQERIGDRVEADYHFYREMEAKRKQKHPIIRFLELLVQYIFGYGVHPWQVITTWLVTVFCLAFVYWMGNGVLVGGELEVAADSFWDTYTSAW